MVVLIAFERPPVQFLRRHFPGLYCHSSLIVMHGGRAAWYDIEPYQVYHRKSAHDLALDDEMYDYIMLDTTPDEDDQIMRTCDACCECRIQYNQWDQYMRGTPFWSPMDFSLFEGRPLYSAQSIVLILRESLNEQNPVLTAVKAINSRVISGSGLKNELCDFSHTIPASGVGRLLNACRAGALCEPVHL